MRALVTMGLLGLFGIACQKPERPTPVPVASLEPAPLASASIPLPVPSAPAVAHEPPELVVFQLERGLCYGSCPSYSIAVHADGTVDYRGEAYVKEHGARTGKVDPATVQELAARFDAAGFFGLKWEEPCRQVATDHSTVKIAYAHAGKDRKIDDYLGNRCMPPVLRELEAAIDELAHSAQWTRCASGHCPR